MNFISAQVYHLVATITVEGMDLYWYAVSFLLMSTTEQGNMLKGHITSKTAKQLIKEWALLHQDELVENWHHMEKGKQFNKIAPLD